MPKYYAIVEIGSRGVRLLVGECRRGELIYIGSDGDIANLGAGMSANGEMSETSMDRAAELVRRYSEAARQRWTVEITALCTEAIRRASNKEQLVRKIAPYVDRACIITPEQECYYAFVAVLRSLPNVVPGNGAALVIDQGGGSVELTFGEITSTKIVSSGLSLPLGTLGLSDVLLGVPDGAAARDEIGGRIASAFTDDVLARFSDYGSSAVVFGVGSSISKLAQRLTIEGHGTPPRLGELHGCKLPKAKIESFLIRTEAQFGTVEGPLGESSLLQEDRDIPTIYSGIRVFKFVLDTIGGDGVILSRHGVSHGAMAVFAGTETRAAGEL